MANGKNKAYEVSKYTAKLFSRTEKYAANVEKLFSVAVDELLKIASGGELGDDGTFSFSGNKRLSSKANKVLRGLYSSVYNEIKGDVSSEWEYANLSCDELVASVFGEGLDEDNHFVRWFTRNKEAVDAFFKRKSAYGGLNLSQRVWQYVDGLKTEMEVALSVSLGQGDSASTISRKVRKYLNNPDDMFRRFRVKVGEDEEGNPVYGRKWKRKYIDRQTGKVTWKDFDPKDYHTGRGVYRSAYKNAMRLTRTETNMAYRSAEQDRWQNMDFVLGYRVKRSKNHPAADICDELSADNGDNESDRGVYPKTFVFKGWHPQCRCFVVPILASRADFVKMQKALLNGEEPPQPSGIIAEPNEYFNNWVSKNQDRIEGAKTLPYWIKDNKNTIEKTQLDTAVKETAKKARAVGDEVQSLAESIAAKFGAVCTPINYKSEASIKRKVMAERADDKPQFMPNMLKDTVRTTIVAPKDKIADVIEKLSQEPRVKEMGNKAIKKQLPKKYLGYSGNIVNLKASNGLVAEIQVNTAKMIYAKELPENAKKILGEKVWNDIRKEVGVEGGLGHKYYEEWRVMSKEKQSSATGIALKKKSEEYYAHFTE